MSVHRSQKRVRPCGDVETPHLICWGDSLTQGEDWMAFLSAVGKPTWTHTDLGEAGADSWDPSAGISVASGSAILDWADWFPTYTPAINDVFVVFYGTNDVRKTDWEGLGALGDGDRTHLTTKAAYDQILDLIYELGRPAVIVRAPAFIGGAGLTHTAIEVTGFNSNLENEMDARLLEIIAERNAVGKCIAYADVYNTFINLPGWPDITYFDDLGGDGDGVHPGIFTTTPSGLPGRQHVCQTIVNAVESLLVPR